MQSMVPGEDETLLAKIAAGDHHAFRVLFDLYHNKVYSYSIRFLRSEARAEEIVQEVFINIWIGRSKITQIQNFGAYLRVVTKNITLNTLRKIALDFKVNAASGKEWTEVDNYTESSILLKETHALLNEAIESLPKQQQLVYKLCQVEGLKQKEAAKMLNISPSTIKVHLREATKAIRIFMVKRTELSVLLFLFIWTIK